MENRVQKPWKKGPGSNIDIHTKFFELYNVHIGYTMESKIANCDCHTY